MSLPVVFIDKKTGETQSVESISDPRDAYIEIYNQNPGSSGAYAEKPSGNSMKFVAQPVSDRVFKALVLLVVFIGLEALTRFAQFVWGIINLILGV
jgi:hypothetical protein